MCKNTMILIFMIILHFTVIGVKSGYFRERTIKRVRTVKELYKKGNEFAVLDFIGYVQQHQGYVAEEYDVETEDGYILKLHRISGSPNSPKAPGKPVIYIQHFLLGCTDIFVALGPNKALAYFLADAGYDIWLGNVRGSTYSRRHVKYSSRSSNYNFWNFSLDEMGTIDVPTFIDAVLEKTNEKKLTYIGHSMGTTLNYILLASKPEYNDKINLAISFTPAAFFVKPFSFVFYCILLTRPLFDDVSTIFSVIPAGASWGTMIHYSQMAFTEEFRKFDFGLHQNLQIYSSVKPPEYNLTKITVPLAMYYSESDVFIRLKESLKLKKRVGNVVAFEKAPDSYNHLDFVFGKNTTKEFYCKVLTLIKKFT